MLRNAVTRMTGDRGRLHTRTMNAIDKKNIMKAVLSGTLTDVKNTLKKHKLVQDESYFDYELLKASLNRKEYTSHPISKFLIREGCRIRNPNKQKDRTPLHISIFLNKDIIKALLARRASIYEKNKKNETVLFAAFKHARLSATEILLNYCGMKDLDPADEDDVVHFYIACVRGHLNAIKLYLTHGFDINSPLRLNSSKYKGVQPKSYEHTKTGLDLPYKKSLYWRSYCENSDSSGSEWEYDLSENESDAPNLLHTRIIMTCTVYPSHNPLHFAVKYAFAEVVELLLTHGADCNKKDLDGKTPLHWACEISKCKKTDIIEMLLEHKACTTVQDNNGKTPIHIAFYNKNREKEKIFDTLLAKVQWRLTNYTDYDGLSHFHIACTRNNINAINDFLNSGVPIDHRVRFGVYKDCTALHFAVLHNQKEVVSLLLKRKADVNFKIREDLTSLHLACAYNGEKFNELKCNYDDPMNERWALNRSDQLDIIKLLIDHGADIDVKDYYGKSPIHYACMNYRDYLSDLSENLANEISIRMEEIIKIFLSKKDHGNAHKINPSSVLHIILYAENRVVKVSEKLIEFLVTEGADLCAFNDQGLTPLHIAVKSSNKDLVQIFLKHKVNVNIKSENSLIPLQLVIHKFLQYSAESRDIFCMLLENGSDVNIINENKTILQDAIESNNYFVVERLLHYGADINLVEYLPMVISNITLFKILFVHVKKLVTAGLPVNDNAEKYLNNLPISYEHWDNYFNYMEEIKRMKLEKVDNYTSLYSILRKDQHDLSKHVNNNRLIKIIVDQNIEEKYPLYGYLLKIQFKKGVVRRDVLKSAISSLIRVIKFNLPDTCCDFVLKYLTNEEITNLKSAQFKCELKNHCRKMITI